jgi:hypothetical protein
VHLHSLYGSTIGHLVVQLGSEVQRETGESVHLIDYKDAFAKHNDSKQTTLSYYKFPVYLRTTKRKNNLGFVESL